jgi:hypothetical protein|tara:strand:+ start:346 stop:825 length:480 start_codon:yes stop_codon:yes gene_type:complete
MTKDKKFILVKAMTNIISGLSMVTIISLGIMYMSFDNAFVFTDTKISVVNNPIEQDQDIEFYMVGSKKYQCNSTAAYGVAHATDGSHTHDLNTFTKRYIQATAPGEAVENGWHMKVPDDMKHGGEYRVSMTGEFTCVHMIFKTHKKQVFDNIYLKVDPR